MQIINPRRVERAHRLQKLFPLLELVERRPFIDNNPIEPRHCFCECRESRHGQQCDLSIRMRRAYLMKRLKTQDQISKCTKADHEDAFGFFGIGWGVNGREQNGNTCLPWMQSLALLTYALFGFSTPIISDQFRITFARGGQFSQPFGSHSVRHYRRSWSIYESPRPNMLPRSFIASAGFATSITPSTWPCRASTVQRQVCSLTPRGFCQNGLCSFNDISKQY